MLSRVDQLSYVIVLCDDLERMKAFYRDLFSFRVANESATGLTFRVGSVFLGLRKRTRAYDGRGAGPASPGVQILDPPNNQPWGHRTVYFSDPEGNILEIYAEIGKAP